MVFQPRFNTGAPKKSMGDTQQKTIQKLSAINEKNPANQVLLGRFFKYWTKKDLFQPRSGMVLERPFVSRLGPFIPIAFVVLKI